MSAQFLNKAQRKTFGKYAYAPTPEQLDRYFYLDDRDSEIISRLRGHHNRLGFALQLGTVRFLGTSIIDLKTIPKSTVNFVAQQLNIRNKACLIKYSDIRRQEHLKDIKRVYGYTEYTDDHARFRFLRWLFTRAWLGDERPSVLFDLATRQLLVSKTLLPRVTTLERIVSQAREKVNKRLSRKLNAFIPPEEEINLLRLLESSESTHYSWFDDIKQPEPRVSSATILTLLRKLAMINDIKIHHIDLRSVPHNRLKQLSRYAYKSHVSTLRRMPKKKCLAILFAFVVEAKVSLIDDTLDVFDEFIAEIKRNAKTAGQKARLRTLRDLDKAALLLSSVCSILVEHKKKNIHVDKAIYSKTAKSTIEKAIHTIEDISRPPKDTYQEEWLTHYHRIRKFLSQFQQGISLKGTSSAESLLTAYQQLTSLSSTERIPRKQLPTDFITGAWRRWVFKDTFIDPKAYTVCVIKQINNALKHRDIYALPSERWGDPRLKLLRGIKWTALKANVCRSLNLSDDPKIELSQLAKELDGNYKAFINGLASNNTVRIGEKNNRPKLIVSPVEKLEEPESLIVLKEKVASLMPIVDLPELLLEIQRITGFADCFTHISEAESRADAIDTSLCAVLMAEACNIGYPPVVNNTIPALTHSRLKWVKQNYYRTEALLAANAKLVDVHSNIPLVKVWGGGEVASADGLRFVTPIRTAYSRSNKKYFGSSQGITFYNYLSNQYAGFHGLMIPGVMRDSVYLLQGILEQQSSLKPQEVMTDTAGASQIVFALFWLLGYQFSPRLADVGSIRLWRMDKTADYGELNALTQNRISLKKIEQEWETFLRVAGSLKTGTISASELIRTLLNSKQPSSLFKSLREFGRIIQTNHLLRLFNDEGQQRRILTQLNRGESRHSLARAVFHGNRGEMRQKYRDGQEDQIGALGLVLNVIVIWNTLYMQQSLDYLRRHGHEVKEEDVARLSPLSFEHINFLGRYFFVIDPAIRKGRFRPLRH